MKQKILEFQKKHLLSNVKMAEIMKMHAVTFSNKKREKGIYKFTEANYKSLINWSENLTKI